MTQNEEQRIIERVLSGDKNAFEGLVLANQNNVYNLALKLTGNEEDALDNAQEAFLKAYIQLSSFRAESRFSVWLYRLTYNQCIDFLRKKQKMTTVSLTSSDEDNDSAEIEVQDIRALPEDIILTDELRKTITESIDELGSEHREIIMMREITGMSYSDIAAVLNISEGTVKSRIARARKVLVSILMSKGTFPDTYRQKERKEVEEHE